METIRSLHLIPRVTCVLRFSGCLHGCCWIGAGLQVRNVHSKRAREIQEDLTQKRKGENRPLRAGRCSIIKSSKQKCGACLGSIDFDRYEWSLSKGMLYRKHSHTGWETMTPVGLGLLGASESWALAPESTNENLNPIDLRPRV